MKADAANAPVQGLRAWWPWCATVLFVLWQVDFQFIYGFVAEPIQKELDLTASQAAAVSSVYLFSYGLMQLPAGWLLDRFSLRWLLPLMAVCSALSVFFFARSDNYFDLLLGRVMAGTFMAFAFPASGKIARIRLPANRFPLAMALADMCFGVGAVLAGGLPGLFGDVSWREIMRWLGLLGLGLSILVWVSLRGVGKEASTFQPDNMERGSIIQLLKRRPVFLGLLLYVWGAGLTFGFGGYWNLKLQESCGCTAPQVSEISTGLFAGLAIGMLLAGIFGGKAEHWRPILKSGTSLAFILLAMTLGISSVASVEVLVVIMVGLGMVLGTCSLSFAVAVHELPTRQAATVVALVNAGGCLSGALLQELPVWIGGGTATLMTVSISYLSVAILGILAAYRLPTNRAE